MSDQAARRHAITTSNETLLVEAGAGTGKTTLLIDRIVALVESDVKIERIAAVTFTVKAAGELKQRLREELLKRSGSPKVHAALESLDRMTVTTIHGFASEMLRTLPVEAKLPPDFIALDEFQQSAVMEEFAQEWLGQALEADVPSVFEKAEILGLDLLSSQNKTLLDLFRAVLRSHVDPAKLKHAAETQADTYDLLSHILLTSEEFAAAAPYCHTRDDLFVDVQTVSVWKRSAPSSLDTLEGLLWLNQLVLNNLNSGNQANWTDKSVVARAKVQRKAISAAVHEARQTICTNVANGIAAWIAPAITEYRAHLRERGSLGFDDLLLCCRDMLRDSTIARNYFKSQYDYVHIDEFQDTDPLQVEIAFFLCEQDGQFASDWRHITQKPGKLFIVGDPKQSIYSFRGADVRIYREVSERLQLAGRQLAITTNFRSRPSILREVNELFAPVMMAQNRHVAQYQPVYASERAVHDRRAVELLLPPQSYTRQEKNVDLTAKYEAAAVAAHLAALHAQGMEYRQAAILLRKGLRVHILQEALSARGIPFISFMNSVFINRVEVEALLTMLTALANPQHTVAIIGVLRSAWFSLTDDDLYLHKLAGGNFVYTDARSADSNIAAALNELKRWHERSKHISAAALIEALLAEFPIEVIYGLKSEGTQRVQNFQTVIEIVRRLEQGGSTSLDEIVKRLSEMERLVQSTELEARDSDRDAVQILTIHKAKGLEFPVVYLFNFDEHERTESSWQVNTAENGIPQIALKFGAKCSCTLNYEEVKKANQDARGAERERQLYVALTRARDKLVIPLSWTRASKKADTAKVVATLRERYWDVGKNSVVVEGREVEATYSSAEPITGFRPYALSLISSDALASSKQDPVEARWWHDRSERIARLQSQTPRTDLAPPIVDWQQMRARKVGTYIHSVLEKVARGAEMVAASRIAASAVALTFEEEAEARELLQSVLASALFTVELPRARRVLTELPITAASSTGAVQRAADLLFENEHGKWVLLDYKTDKIPAEAVSTQAEAHRSQLAEYAAMLARVIGSAPSEMRVYFVRPNIIYRLP